jgi:tetratricopeptide (TPR) repeat protein
MGPTSSIVFASTTLEAGTISLEGVRLSHFRDFLAYHGGRDKFQGLSVSEVCDKFMKPVTKTLLTSYCDMLRKTVGPNEEKHPSIDRAQVYVIYSWSSLFLDVLDALLYTFRDNLGIVIWMDLFSINTHHNLPLTSGWAREVIPAHMKEFDSAVFVLPHWKQVDSLQRTWCLWELYCLKMSEIKFQIAFLPSELILGNGLFHEIVQDPEDFAYKLFKKIDVANSLSSKENDRIALLKVFDSIIPSYNEMNVQLFHFMLDKVIEMTETLAFSGLERSLQSVDEDIENQQSEYCNLLYKVSRLMCFRGKYKLAEAFLLRVDSTILSKKREGVRLTLLNSQNLAYYYLHTFQYLKAEQYATKCLELKQETFPEDHSEVAIAYDCLGEVSLALNKYAVADQLIAKSYGIRQETDDPQITDSLQHLLKSRLASGKYRDVEELYEGHITGSKKSTKCPINKTQMLQLHSILGELYSLEGKFREAEDVLVDCKQHAEKLYGHSNPKYLVYYRQLTTFYDHRGMRSPVPENYQDCINQFMILLPEYHIECILTRYNLDQLDQQLLIRQPASY